MVKELIVILNKNITCGKMLNGLGHMMIGMGPRIPEGYMPNMSVYLASAEYVSAFRQKAVNCSMQYPRTEIVFSDFAHTTTDGSAQDHEQQTAAIKENEINYFAVGICAEQEILRPLKWCVTKNQEYRQIITSEKVKFPDPMSNFEFESPINSFADFLPVDDQYKKFSIAVGRMSTGDTIYTLIHSCLQLSSQADRDGLRLHTYPDADGSLHPGMSEYGLVVLKAKATSKLKVLDDNCKRTDFQISRVYESNGESLLSIGMFGIQTQINQLTKKDFSLWSGSIVESDLQTTADEVSPSQTEYFEQSSVQLKDLLKTLNFHPQ